MNLEMCSFSYALIVCSHVISIPVRYWSGARRSRERSDSARENKILEKTLIFGNIFGFLW